MLRAWSAAACAQPRIGAQRRAAVLRGARRSSRSAPPRRTARWSGRSAEIGWLSRAGSRSRRSRRRPPAVTTASEHGEEACRARRIVPLPRIAAAWPAAKLCAATACRRVNAGAARGRKFGRRLTARACPCGAGAAAVSRGHPGRGGPWTKPRSHSSRRMRGLPPPMPARRSTASRCATTCARWRSAPSAPSAASPSASASTWCSRSRTTPPPQADDVDQVISYDTITEAIEAELAAERVNLLETLAERVAHRCLADPRAVRVFVRIEKLDRIPGALGVEIVRARLPEAAARLRPVAAAPGGAGRAGRASSTSPPRRWRRPPGAAWLDALARLGAPGGALPRPRRAAARPRPPRRRRDRPARDRAGRLGARPTATRARASRTRAPSSTGR